MSRELQSFSTALIEGPLSALPLSLTIVRMLIADYHGRGVCEWDETSGRVYWR